MSEETKTAQRYQWIKGEKAGNVVELEKAEGEWTYFKGGSRVSTILLPEFLIPLEGDALPLTSDLKAIGSVAVGGPKVTDKENAIEVPKEEVSPIGILFDKQSKNDKVQLKINFPIEVPKVDIYNIIKVSFGEDEVKDELTAFILKQLEEDDILDSLHKSIEDLIEERYKGI